MRISLNFFSSFDKTQTYMNLERSLCNSERTFFHVRNDKLYWKAVWSEFFGGTQKLSG